MSLWERSKMKELWHNLLWPMLGGALTGAAGVGVILWIALVRGDLVLR